VWVLRLRWTTPGTFFLNAIFLDALLNNFLEHKLQKLHQCFCPAVAPVHGTAPAQKSYRSPSGLFADA